MKMDKAKQILLCVVPYIVAAGMLYPMAAIVGASWDAFAWERTDRVFFFICAVIAGTMLAFRINHGEE
jgi:hypothetical protein